MEAPGSASCGGGGLERAGLGQGPRQPGCVIARLQPGPPSGVPGLARARRGRSRRLRDAGALHGYRLRW